VTAILRNGTRVEDARLDRLPSDRTDHLEKFPLTAATLPSTATPVVIGVNWYAAFDRPVRRRIRGWDYWTIGGGDLGRIRGGHAVCLRPWTVRDAAGWWPFYNQGVEGRCVEFAWLRALSLMNRQRYDITSRWHYWQMQQVDEWSGGSYPGASPRYEGTSVRAGGEVMRQWGAIPALRGGAPLPLDNAGDAVRLDEGIAAYRWATSWDDVRTVLGVPGWCPGVPMLNSWGRGYPRQVLLLDDTGARLHAEDGEMGVATDR
jgi:hypothetical protein